MKLIKEYIINEKFTDESDPINDMGIGLKYLIKKWLNNHNVKDNNYIINNDGSIDIFNNLNLLGNGVEKFPKYINFNYIKGNCTICYFKVDSITGILKNIGGYLNFMNTNLKRIDFLPEILTELPANYAGGNGYAFSNNKLITLEGLPEILNCSLWINNNPFKTLRYLPKKINGYLFIDRRFSENQIRRVCDVKKTITLV